MITRELRDGVDWVRMSHGSANAMDLELLRELRDAFERPAKALVLAGTGKIFCAGVDLERFLAEGEDYAEAFLIELDRCFRYLFEATFPVVACVNGHAIAGGAILALAADERIATTASGRFGVPELLVGVPFPSIAMEILRFGAPRATWTRLFLRGETIPLAEAAELGLVDEVVDASELEDRAQARALALASILPPAFAATKAALRRPAIERYEAALGQEERLRAIWTSAECKSAIRDYVARVLGK